MDFALNTYTDSAFADALRLLMVPPVRGSWSGDKDWSAMDTSLCEGNGTSIVLAYCKGKRILKMITDIRSTLYTGWQPIMWEYWPSPRIVMVN